MYLVESKSEYKVELWKEEGENKVYKINDTLPLKDLDRSISLNCYIINRFYAFNIEWGILKEVVDLSSFRGKDISNIKFYNSFGELLRIDKNEDLELSKESDYLLINNEEKYFKEFGTALMNIDKLHIWERDKYNKNMRNIRRIIKSNENFISNYLYWLDKNYIKKATNILEGIITVY